MKDFTTIKGMKEFLPTEMELRCKLIDTISDIYTANGFSRIKTPILENLELLCRGDSGDNSKLMFKTIKRGEKLRLDKVDLSEEDLVEEGLRYDLTVPLCRFYCNNKNTLTIPFKAIQIDDVFRAEKPQRGRYRQFTQCDIDIFGESSNIAEIELLITAIDAYKALGIDVAIAINNRQILESVIKSYGVKDDDISKINISLDKLDKIGAEGVIQEVCQRGYALSNVTGLVETIVQVRKEGISALSNTKVESSLLQDMQTVIDSIKNLRPDADIYFDIAIVRGQGYYTSYVYEVYAKGVSFRSALGGGGRYDRMIQDFCGVSVPAVGFSIGLDSVMAVMDRQILSDKVALVYSNTDIVDVLRAKDDIIKRNDVAIFAKQKNFKAQLDKLKSNGYAVLLKLENGVLSQPIDL